MQTPAGKIPLSLFLIGLALAVFFFMGSEVVTSTPTPRLLTSASLEDLTVELSTDKEVYYQGENVTIEGTVTDPEGKPVENGRVMLRLECDEWKVRRWVEIENDGSYRYDYQISFGDPPSPPKEVTETTWQIWVKATERGSNLTGKSATKNIKVKIPDISVYNVNILSPPNGGSYQRREEIAITVKVIKEGFSPESNVDVSTRSPTGDKITLPILTTGTFQTTYAPKKDDPLGEWWISIEAKNKKENKVGGSYVKVEIKPASLFFKRKSWKGTQEPEEWELLTKFKAGDEVKVKVKLQYPDYSDFTGGTVIMRIGEENELVLREVGGGEYEGALSREDPGDLLVEITAEDAYGNRAERSVIFYFAPVEVTSPMLYVGASIGAGIALVAIVVVRRQQRLEKLGGIRWEKDHVQKLLVKEAEKYFKEGSITREVYDDLVRIHHTRLAELEKEERMLTGKK